MEAAAVIGLSEVAPTSSKKYGKFKSFVGFEVGKKRKRERGERMRGGFERCGFL